MGHQEEISGGDLRTRFGYWADYRFRVFISYSHNDIGWAERIEAKFNRFVMPIELTALWTPFGPPPRRMKPVFRDRSQARSSHSMDSVLTDALDDSAALIVVCSPSAGSSPGVEKEVAHFVSTGRRDRIFPVLIEGEPSSVENCPFPESLRSAIASEDSSVGVPLAADARPNKDGWPGAFYKLVAGLANVDVGMVTRDDQRRERFERMRRYFGAGLLVVFLMVSVLSTLVWGQRQEALLAQSKYLNRAADEAIRAGAAQDGVLLALEALPIGEGILFKRPYYSPARSTLEFGLSRLRIEHVLRAHDNAVTAVAFSSDSRLLLTGSADNTARLWDAATGEELRAFEAHADSVTDIKFTPNADRVVIASRDGAMSVWDTQSGAQKLVLLAHDAGVQTVDVSPNGEWILTTSSDGTAIIWDARTGAIVSSLSHEAGIVGASFSPDGSLALTTSWDRTAGIWSVPDGRLIAKLAGHYAGLRFGAFSPSGELIVTTSWDGTARLWDTSNGALAQLLIGHSDSVNWAAFSPDGAQLATASDDNTVKIWDVKTGENIATLEGDGGDVFRLNYSPSGSIIATASRDGAVRIWELGANSIRAILRGHENTVNDVVFSPDGTKIASVSDDRTARLWRMEDYLGRCRSGCVTPAGEGVTAYRGHSALVNDVTFSPSGELAATASWDRTARIWNVKTGALIAELGGDAGHRDWVRSVAFSPDGGRVVTASSDRTAKIWDARSGSLILTLAGHGDRVLSAQYAPDGARIITASGDQSARIWNAETGELLEILQGHKHTVWYAEFSPDGSSAVTASADGTARIWRPSRRQSGDAYTRKAWLAPQGDSRLLAGHQGEVNSARFSPDGVRIVTASDDGTARVWNAESAEVVFTLEGHSHAVNNATFSSDGAEIATAADDATARIWNASNGSAISILRGHEDPVRVARFSPDGRYVATAAIDGVVRIWDRENLPQPRSLGVLLGAACDRMREIGQMTPADKYIADNFLNSTKSIACERRGLLSAEFWRSLRW